MSFAETPGWLERIGFLNRISLRLDQLTSPVGLVVNKGGLVFGFAGEGGAYGYLVNSNTRLTMPTIAGTMTLCLTMDLQGYMRVETGDASAIRGIGAGVEGIPWYTLNSRALIAKAFIADGFYGGLVVCDDPYWCEFEGAF